MQVEENVQLLRAHRVVRGEHGRRLLAEISVGELGHRAQWLAKRRSKEHQAHAPPTVEAGKVDATVATHKDVVHAIRQVLVEHLVSRDTRWRQHERQRAQAPQPRACRWASKAHHGNQGVILIIILVGIIMITAEEISYPMGIYL